MKTKNTARLIITVRKFLLIFVFLAVGYLVFVFLSPILGWDKKVVFNGSDLESPDLTLNLKNFDDFENLAKSKKVFFNPATPVNAVVVPPPQEPIAVAIKVPEIPIEEIAQNYSLVGVLNGANPQAIIADKKNNRTVYVYKGQLLGDSNVVDIEDKKVILNHKGRTFELLL